MARAIGLLAGLAIVAVAVLAWRIPPGTGRLGADVVMVSIPTGEIAVEPTGPFLSQTGMHPGPREDAATGKLTLYNQTGRTLDLQLRALPSSQEMDDILWIDVRAGDTTWFHGSLGEMRTWSTEHLTIASADSADLRFRVWLPEEVEREYEGRIETVTLEFHSEVAG